MTAEGKQPKLTERVRSVFDAILGHRVRIADPSELGFLLTGNDTLNGRIEAAERMLGQQIEELTTDPNPQRLISISEALLKAAATAWGAAQTNYIVAQAFKDWEELIDTTSDAVEVWGLKDKELEERIRIFENKLKADDRTAAADEDWISRQIESLRTLRLNNKQDIIRFVRRTAITYSKKMYDWSFAENHLTPQYLIQLQQLANPNAALSAASEYDQRISEYFARQSEKLGAE